MHGPWNSTFLLFSISTYNSRNSRNCFLYWFLRIAAKSRNKPTYPPPGVERGEKMTKWQLPKRYIRNANPLHCSHGSHLMLIITPLKPNTRTLSRPIPRHDMPPRGNRLKGNRQLQLLLLCEDRSVNTIT